MVHPGHLYVYMMMMLLRIGMVAACEEHVAEGYVVPEGRTLGVHANQDHRSRV